MGLFGDDDKRMTFTEHLGELRVRLIRVVVGIAVVFTLCLIFWQQLFNVLSHPLVSTQVEWISIKPMESMSVAFRLAGTCAVFFCAPHIIYEICAFVFPGLRPKEKKIALYLVLGGCTLAMVGAAVAYFLVSPQLIGLMTDWTPAIVKQQLQMSDTIDFEVFLLLAFAAAFQFPMIVLILVYLGVLSRDTLKKYRRHAIVLLSIAAAAITPTTDPISFLAMWAPLVIMYEACIWIAFVVEPKQPM